MTSPSAATNRRRLYLVGGTLALGIGFGVARHVVMTPRPPDGNPLAVDLAGIVAGRLVTVDWKGRAVWVLRRSAEDIAMLMGYEAELTDPMSLRSLQPDYCRNANRSLRPEIFVAIGQCTHQGCPPQLRIGSGGRGEFLCPCHTSRFDLAGRVFRAGPASDNLVIPEYRFDGENRLVIGEA